MTPPAPSPRGTPSGRKLGDGFPTRISIALAPDAPIWEKTVTPPGWDGGEPVDTSDMLNTQFHTLAPRHLITMTTMACTAHYDPALAATMNSIINKPTTVTVHYPDGSSLAFYGYVKSFKPSSNEEGKPAEAAMEVQPTNQDPVTCSEEFPVYTPGSGTATSC
jgi:hypothetical protein